MSWVHLHHVAVKQRYYRALGQGFLSEYRDWLPCCWFSVKHCFQTLEPAFWKCPLSVLLQNLNVASRHLKSCCMDQRHAWAARRWEKYSDPVLPSCLEIKRTPTPHPCISFHVFCLKYSTMWLAGLGGVWQGNRETTCFTVSRLHIWSEKTSWQWFNFYLLICLFHCPCKNLGLLMLLIQTRERRQLRTGIYTWSRSVDKLSLTEDCPDLVRTQCHGSKLD